MESMGRPESASTSGRSRFPFATAIAIIVVIVASIGALFYFSSARVEVTANTVSAAVQGSFTAAKSTGDLPFEIITAQKVASQSVKSTGTKAVNTSASGTITIYNTQSKAQKLIANTRFATTAGLIFRIHAPVSVPGGTAAKPGSVNAKVYADQAGSTYNVAATSFTIPGFAGTPQESAVYGRSTSPMAGGSSGNIPVIDAGVEMQAKDALTAALAPDLASSLQTQVPAGYILLPGAATTSFEELEPTQSATAGEADVKEQGTISAIVFPNSALAKAVATSVAGRRRDEHDFRPFRHGLPYIQRGSVPNRGGRERQDSIGRRDGALKLSRGQTSHNCPPPVLAADVPAGPCLHCRGGRGTRALTVFKTPATLQWYLHG
jgi:hypothetical protein